jgi:ketosteroid isomerase-like protein
MSVVQPEFAEAFAAEWVAAWNARDLDRVLHHYREDVELRSPLIASVAGEPSGCLRGKTAIRSYWTQALARIPSLHFEPIDLLLGADCLTIYYRGHRGPVAETFFFDGDGKVRQATACYSTR